MFHQTDSRYHRIQGKHNVRTAIWIKTAPMLAADDICWVPRAFRLLCISWVALASETTASDQDDVPPGHNFIEDREPRLGKSITHEIEKSRPRRVSIARLNPIRRAKLRWFSGRRPTRIEMNMMLSIPRTISRAVNVTSATHACGLVSHSNKRLPLYDIQTCRDIFSLLFFFGRALPLDRGILASGRLAR
jgi:hypothetical protein